MENTEYLYSLRIVESSSLTACVKIVRKYTSLSISDIQKAISDGTDIYSCMCYEEKKLSQMIRLYKELTKAGTKVELFDEGEPFPIEHLINQSESVKDTRRSFGDISDDEI